MAVINLNNSAINIPPTAVASFVGGATEIVNSSTNYTAQLDGGDSDGGSSTINTYTWERRVNAGAWIPFMPVYVTTYSDTVQTTAVYEYRLKVLNNLNDESAYSNIITLTHTQSSNVAPIAKISNPATGVYEEEPFIYNRPNTYSGIYLFGQGSSDSDGTIVSYEWAIVSAPSGSIATINNPVASNTSISNLKEGTYTIRLTVTDNGGLTDSLEMTVNLTAAPVIFTDGNPVSTACTTTYTGTVLIPNNTSGDVTATLLSGNLDSLTGDLSIGSNNNLVSGEYDFTLVLDNSGALGVESRVLIEVNLSSGGITSRLFSRTSAESPNYNQAVC